MNTPPGNTAHQEYRFETQLNNQIDPQDDSQLSQAGFAAFKPDFVLCKSPIFPEFGNFLTCPGSN
jgi:hypothetical protein